MKYRFSSYRLGATAGLLFVILSILSLGGVLEMFFNPYVIFMIFGITFFLLLGTYEKEFLLFIPHCFRIFLYRPEESNPRFAQMALFASRAVLGAGLIAMIIQIIGMFRSLADPVSFGPAMAYAMIPPLLALIISEVFFAFVHQSFRDDKSEKVLPLKNAGIASVVILFAISAFFILMLSYPDTAIDFSEQIGILPQ